MSRAAQLLASGDPALARSRRTARERRPALGRGLLALALGAALAPHAAGSSDAPDAGTAASGAPAVPSSGTPDAGAAPGFETVSGTISALSSSGHEVTLEVDGRPLTLALDRNTSVFLPGRLGTVRDLVVGAPVRVSYGPGRLAYWLEIPPR